MGVVKGISAEAFPAQDTDASFGGVGARVRVCFNYDASRYIGGEVVRNDRQEPGRMIIKLDDGRYVLATECMWSPTIAAASRDRPAGATSQCPHSDLHFHLFNSHSGDTNLHYLTISARCKICDVPMVFRGLPGGQSPHQPMGSPDGREARLPFLGDGEDLTGKPIGFTINKKEA